MGNHHLAELAEVAPKPAVELVMVGTRQGAVHPALAVDSDDGQDASLMRRHRQLVELQRHLPVIAAKAALVEQLFPHAVEHRGRGGGQHARLGGESLTIVDGEGQGDVAMLAADEVDAIAEISRTVSVGPIVPG